MDNFNIIYKKGSNINLKRKSLNIFNDQYCKNDYSNNSKSQKRTFPNFEIEFPQQNYNNDNKFEIQNRTNKISEDSLICTKKSRSS